MLKRKDSDIPNSPTAAAPYLEIDCIRKQYGDTCAADDVCLEIAEHEFLTLLGPSGSGKTTLLMTIAGFIPPDSGRILIQGRDVTAKSASSRNIGVVFQNYALFPHMSVYDNVAYPLKMRRTPRGKIGSLVEEILEMVQLGGMGKLRPAQLSGGQQQRVALARALVFNPPILLMDEPLSALDRKLRQSMQLELKRLQAQLGVTIVYVTHDQEEALAMSSRIAVMNRGAIEQIGAACEVYDRPVSRFVAEFIGETNLFEAKVVRCEGDIVHLSSASFPGMTVKSGRPLQSGQWVHLAVRPERISPVAGENGHGCVVEGTVDEVVYLGEASKYFVRLDAEAGGEGHAVVMKAQNRNGAAMHCRGDRLRIGWDERDAVLVFDHISERGESK